MSCLDHSNFVAMDSLCREKLNKISEALHQHGYSVLRAPGACPKTEVAEVDDRGANLMAEWLDSIVETVAQVCEDVRVLQESVVARNADNGDLITIKTLESTVQRLEKSLRAKEQMQKSLENKIFNLEQSNKGASGSEHDKWKSCQAKIRSLESLLQESERRNRQKEREYDRLRDKLRLLVDKDKMAPLVTAQYVHEPLPAGGKAAKVIQAPEIKDRKAPTNRIPAHQSTKNADSSNAISSTSNFPSNDSRDISETSDVDPIPTTDRSGQILFYDEREIGEQEHDICSASDTRRKFERTIHLLQQQNSELIETVDNLSLELQARPTMKKWREVLQQLQESEEKISDLLTYRKEELSLESWRRKLPTAERIKIDKKNHDLGIWLMESLPKTTLVETVQLICRELDLSNVADLHPSLKKLKAVVRVVPQMEKVLSKILIFLGDRNKILLEQLRIGDIDDDGLFSITHIMPTLERWWGMCQRCIELERFKDEILFELFRGEFIISQQYSVSSNMDPLGVKEEWTRNMRSMWHLKPNCELRERIHALIDLEVEFVNNSGGALDVFINDRPDLVVNRIIHHVQYLFNLTSVDQILPTINAIYLFTEQMKNFLASLRTTLNCDTHVPLSGIIDRTLQILSGERVY